ncbi:hypothetical protein B0H17DRAFT_1144740 [Mycena rosella]|uniref:Uncharacterized protein n=1 Tax=Mycena rosella TaxID=1033263 RepID=A0AAD7CSL2_MYCRO|nr:hypothetical protein B0H17DRAFT_1144740 [Mycena rosella]
MVPWLIAVISRILASDVQSRSPTITEVIVTFYHPWYRMGSADISSETFTFPAALEKLLFRHPTVPRVLWRAQDQEGSLAHFARFVRAAMPNMQAREKVALEQFAPSWNGVTGYSCWYLGIVAGQLNWGDSSLKGIEVMVKVHAVEEVHISCTLIRSRPARTKMTAVSGLVWKPGASKEHHALKQVIALAVT